MELNEILEKTGLSLDKIIEFIPQIKKFAEIGKQHTGKILEYEKTLGLKENQKPIYAGLVTDSGKVLLKMFIIEQRGEETLIVEEKFSFDAFEQIEKITDLIPNM